MDILFFCVLHYFNASGVHNIFFMSFIPRYLCFKVLKISRLDNISVFLLIIPRLQQLAGYFMYDVSLYYTLLFHSLEFYIRFLKLS